MKLLRAHRASLSVAAALVAGLFLAAAPSPARAEVWGYIDDKGVAHFSSEKSDDRYELFFKGGESFDTSQIANATPRAVAVPTLPPKLIAYFEVSPNYKAVKHVLREAAVSQDIDYELIQAVIATESGFDPTALSPKGAVGLMQVMPTTAQRYGIEGDKKNTIEKKLQDPRVNIRTGTRYLRAMLDLFSGDLKLALAAYNAGEGAVKRAGNQIPDYRETQNYVKTVMQLYGILKPPTAVADLRRPPTRVRMELTGKPIGGPAAGPVGGAVGRGNMPPSLLGAPARPQIGTNPNPNALSTDPTASGVPVAPINFKIERD